MSYEKGFYEKKSWGSVSITESKDLPTLKLHYLLKQLTKGSVLEIGSGSGRILSSIHERNPNLKLTGVDISKEQVRIAKRDNPGITFVVGDAEKLPFKADTFDAVIFLDVIEHVHHPDKLLREAYRVCKPGGILHGMSPCEDHGIYKLSTFLLGWHIKEKTAGHIQRYTRTGLVQRVQKAGFRITNLRYSYHLLGSIMDYTLFALLLNKTIAKLFWQKNKYYKDKQTKQTVISRIFNGILSVANGIAYYESTIFQNTPLFATALHITAQK